MLRLPPKSTRTDTRFPDTTLFRSSLDQIMALPVDDPGDEHRIQLPAITGGYSFHAAVFRYADPNAPPALSVAHLRIEPGENIAILGRNGVGKSTILQGGSGMLQPISGEGIGRAWSRDGVGE